MILKDSRNPSNFRLICKINLEFKFKSFSLIRKNPFSSVKKQTPSYRLIDAPEYIKALRSSSTGIQYACSKISDSVIQASDYIRR